MNTLRIFVLGAGMLLSACGSQVGGGGSGGSGGSGGAGGAGGAAGSGGAGGALVHCAGEPLSFPSFEKGCAAAADCVIALHQVNCCGTLTAIGLNASEQAAFDAAENTCRMQYPGCGCAQSPTTTEDGKMSMDDSLIQVDCKNGQCSTFLP